MIRARAVMESLHAHPVPPNTKHWPVVLESAGLSELLRLAIEQENPIIVIGDEGAPLGVVTRKSLLEVLVQYQQRR
jgi:hypothetical protein